MNKRTIQRPLHNTQRTHLQMLKYCTRNIGGPLSSSCVSVITAASCGTSICNSCNTSGDSGGCSEGIPSGLEDGASGLITEGFVPAGAGTTGADGAEEGGGVQAGNCGSEDRTAVKFRDRTPTCVISTLSTLVSHSIGHYLQSQCHSIRHYVICDKYLVSGGCVCLCLVRMLTDHYTHVLVHLNHISLCTHTA